MPFSTTIIVAAGRLNAFLPFYQWCGYSGNRSVVLVRLDLIQPIYRRR